KSGGREDQLSTRKGLDFYRVKALLKIYKLYFSLLKPEEKLLILSEAKRKSHLFIKGAYKHGNLVKIFELNKLYQNLENFLP
ncbi:MAG: glycosyltransferase family 2 protein, partial [Caldimicrobium sp.]